MKKLALTVVIAASFLTACTTGAMQSGSAGKSTYITDGHGMPVKSGDGSCIKSNTPNSKSFPQCEGKMAAQDAPMMAEPKVKTRVIVDCNLCNGNKPK